MRGIVEHAQQRHAFTHQDQRDAKGGEVMEELDGSVDGIADPDLPGGRLLVALEIELVIGPGMPG